MDLETILLKGKAEKYDKIMKIVSDLRNLENPYDFDKGSDLMNVEKRKIDLFNMISAVITGVTSEDHANEIHEVIDRNKA